MIRCKVFYLWVAALPFNGLKDRMISRHMGRCPSCRESLASREEIRRILVQEEDIGGLDGLWPGMEGKLNRPARRDSRSGRRKGWILGFTAAGALAGVFAGVLVFNIFLTRFSPSLRQGGSFEIHHIRVDNRPARTFIVKPPESDMILVWAEKSPKEETGYDI
jgi:hypothetical protein